MLDSLVRVSRRVGWGADIAADPGRLVRRERRSPSPAARRGRGALRTVRPGFGESSRAGGGAARPPGARARATRPAPPAEGGRRRAATRRARRGKARRRSSSSTPGCGESCCRGAVTLGGCDGGGPNEGRPPTGRDAGRGRRSEPQPPPARTPRPHGDPGPLWPPPPPSHLPREKPGLPSRPGDGRGAPPRWKCARRRPGSVRGAVPRGTSPPAPPAAPRGATGGGVGKNEGRERSAGNHRHGRPGTAGLNPPGGLRGPHPFTSQRFHALLNSLFKVLFNFPLRYLLTIGLVPVFSLRWSLPPALGCIPKQPDSEKTRSRRAGGRYRPHTVRGLCLDQKDLGPHRERHRGVGLPYATGPAPHRGAGIRRWALPCSLAVTEGILVSFFSSAD